MKLPVLAYIFAYRGRSHFAQRRYNKALKSFTKAVKFSKGKPLASIWMGYYALTLFYLEDYQSALQCMEKALFGLRTLKTHNREAYWLSHEILARLKETQIEANRSLSDSGKDTNECNIQS